MLKRGTAAKTEPGSEALIERTHNDTRDGNESEDENHVGSLCLAAVRVGRESLVRTSSAQDAQDEQALRQAGKKPPIRSERTNIG